MYRVHCSWYVRESWTVSASILPSSYDIFIFQSSVIQLFCYRGRVWSRVSSFTCVNRLNTHNNCFRFRFRLWMSARFIKYTNFLRDNSFRPSVTKSCPITDTNSIDRVFVPAKIIYRFPRWVSSKKVTVSIHDYRFTTVLYSLCSQVKNIRYYTWVLHEFYFNFLFMFLCNWCYCYFFFLFIVFHAQSKTNFLYFHYLFV